MNLRDAVLDINIEKIIIVDKSSSIDSVKTSLLLRYGTLTRTRITSLGQLAKDLSDLYLKKHKLKLINDEGARLIIESIMNGADVKAEVFKREIITLNTYGSLYTLLLDFKMAGIRPEMIKASNRKIEEIKGIYTLYESTLKEGGLVDRVDILKLPYKKIDAYIYIYENTLLGLLEKEFLDKIANKFKVLGLSNPPGIKRPESQSLIPDIPYDYKVNNLFYLYEGGTNPDTFRLVKAYGYNNEVAFIYRDIISRKLPFDQCQIIYVGSDYADYIQNNASYYKAKTTIQEGLKLDNTKAYFFISQIIWYISKGSLLSDLKPLFISGLIDLGLETKNLLLTNKSIYESLLLSNVSSGARDLKAFIESDKYTPKLEVYEKLREFLGLLERLEDRSLATDKWLLILRNILDTYLVKSDDENMEIKNDILKTIDDYIEGPCSYDQVDEKWLYEIELRLRASRVKMEKAEAGKIHACSYKNTQFLNREYVYVIGLDAKHFPDSQGEDPLLYNKEKLTISKDLSLSGEKSDAYFKLIQLLGSTSGDLTLLYSFYDTDSVREINPSGLMARLLEIKDPILAGFIIEEKNNRLSLMDELIMSPEKILKNEKFNEEAILKPVDIKDKVFSATEIETLIRCKRAHYYKHIVGLEEEREIILGFDGWLDFMDRGSLLHLIFEKVVNGILEKKLDLISLTKQVVYDEFENIKKNNPVLVESHFSFFRDQLYRATTSYMKDYYDLIENKSILTSKTELLISKSAPVEVEIQSGGDKLKVKLAGRIDRVDFLSDGTIDIIDYKSGKIFKENKGEKEVFQDYLYKLACEKLLNKKVNNSRYDFPLETRDNRTWSVNNFKNYREIIEEKESLIYQSLKALQEGHINKTTNKKACEYCPYIVICRNPSEVIQ